jgi:two-component system nitrate/nitrite response regulator NarL
MGGERLPRIIRTIIVDRSALFRAGLTRVLTRTRFRVTAAKASLESLRDNFARADDVGLLLVGLGGISTELVQLPSWKQQYPRLRILGLGSRFDIEELHAAIQAGADGYLLKEEVTTETLLRALDIIVLGEAVLPQKFMQSMRTERRPTPEVLPSGYGPVSDCGSQARDAGTEGADLPSFHRLSEKEQIILDHLTQGASNKHIARDLNLAESTVKVHVKAILRKIRVRNRTQAAMWAMTNPNSMDDPFQVSHPSPNISSCASFPSGGELVPSIIGLRTVTTLLE